jgi:hypothetical protein
MMNGTARPFLWTMTVVGSIWLAVAAASAFSPDMVTGSAQEHLPIAAAADWLWGALATGFVLIGALRPTGDRTIWIAETLAVATIWAAVAVASIAGPQLVTGTDPTRIPLAALLSPIAGVIATGYVAVFVAVSAPRATDERSDPDPSRQLGPAAGHA